MAIRRSEELEQLSNLFGSYKAEWLQDSIFELYSEPSYFPELATTRPCVLNGGRGTGKTTVLRSLSYQGQWEIAKRKIINLDELRKTAQAWPYFGFYYRVNTPRIAAFQGDGLNEEEWQKLFLHYINIIFVQQLIKFLEWYSKEVNLFKPFTQSQIHSICSNLSIKKVKSVSELKNSLSNELIKIESYINNIGVDTKPRISSSGALDAIFSLVTNLKEFKGKIFFIIIDEYENFRNEQQQVINTLIKHTNASYTFKIGVKKLGWRVKNTLNPNENLISPADYVLIDIAEKIDENEFNNFAADVCDFRISKLLSNMPGTEFSSVKNLFPGLTIEEEAKALGVEDLAKDLRTEINSSDCKDVIEKANKLSDLELYTVNYWSKGQNRSVIEGIQDLNANKEIWSMRLEEYKYSAIFTLKKGLPGIKKYYAGWEVISKISGINIRYLLELVEQALLLHIREGFQLGTPIHPKTQTLSAQAVGKKNLEELSGISIHGAKLTKLVLGLGRIFGILAESSPGHTHEVNQFRLKEANTSIRFIDEPANSNLSASEILNAAVMHLALIAFPGNKPKDEGYVKDNTYQLHPIFSPYFVFSHRRRRDLVLTEEDILGLIDSPSNTIKNILQLNNRDLSETPEQLRLFSAYYSKK